MLTFHLPLFSFLLLFSTATTAAQPYTPTDYFLLNCGGETATTSGQTWDTDERSKFVNFGTTTTTFTSTPNYLDPSVPEIPYSTARIFNTSSFTYTFPATSGPKFLRLFFYPATYNHHNPNQSFFSVSSNGYSLLSNFSAFLTASYLGTILVGSPPVPNFVKEFVIYVNDTQTLNVTFTPAPNSYAFINGIEFVSLPENLYHKSEIKYVGQNTGPVIAEDTALENVYRLNVGGGYISGIADTGMYRTWEEDNQYLFPVSANGKTPVNVTPIVYTATPNYTAPELVYETQRSMGNLSQYYNLTWLLPVDSGFYYKLRLHFCNIIPQYKNPGDVIFRIFINNQTAEEEADVLHWTRGSGIPVFKDYVVFVNDNRGKQDLWLAMGPNADEAEEYGDAFLNGLEVFKISMGGSLASPNPELRPTPPPPPPLLSPGKKRSPPYAAIIGGIGGGLVLLTVLGFIVFRRARVKRSDEKSASEQKSNDSGFKLNMTGNLAGPNPQVDYKFRPAPASPSLARKGNNKKTPYAVIAGGVGGGLVLLSMLVLIVFRRRRRIKNYATNHSTLPSDRCRRFSLIELKVATNEFNETCIIGNGGFGKVYKGYLDIATTTVAIKRLNPSSSQGFHEFHTEIGMLSKLRHVQLVSLIGYCDDEGEMILVYDYMAHGTLREHLYKTPNPHLSWNTRLRICIGAANGLHYLHTGANRAIIHRDVKSTNILLDEKWVAKVADFGLSKLGPRDHEERNHVSTVVKGSFGYVDPEYYRTQQLTDKSDVYSFGVVLLEVLCARPVMIPTLPEEQVSLAEWAKISYRNKGTLAPIVDPKVKGEITPECLRKFGEVAINCLKEQSSERPTMEEVVWDLEFALQLQEGFGKTAGEVMPDNQELPFLMQGEPTTTDEEVFTGSSAIRNGTSSISSSFEGFKPETVFSEMQKPTGR